MNSSEPIAQTNQPKATFTVITGSAFHLSFRQLLKTLPQDYVGTLAGIQTRYGPLVHWRVMGGLMNFAFISDARMNRELYVRHTDALEKSPSQVQTFLYAAGRSVATEHGETWRTKRKEANSLFSRQIIEASCAGQVDVVRKFAKTLDKTPQDGLTISRKLAALTSSRGILGRAISMEEADAQIAFSQAAGARFNTESAHLFARPNWMLAPWRKNLSRRKKDAFSIVDAAITELRSSNKPNDGLMAHYVNGDFVTSSDNEMRTILVGLLLGAQDNIAAAVAWVLAYVSQDVPLQDQIRQEIAATDLGANALNSCALLQATIAEILRLRPPAPANQPRILNQNVELAGHTLPKGTYVFNSFYNMHHDAQVFPDPDAFDPHRFLNTTVSRSTSYAPFGHGPRNCVAQGMATQQLAATLSGLLLGHRILPQQDGLPKTLQQPFLVPASFKVVAQAI
ncbi:MAG: cytochrome P450 [Tateyamaria sp.]|uniref:cytochrome P450 n=1 Tax=Tateyamaria sp. TaxID=1929288 RepID=UPI003291FF78